MKSILALTFVLAASAALAADEAPTDGPSFYKAKCASCHGKDGKGNEKVLKVIKGAKLEDLDLTKAETLKDKDEELAKIITDGKTVEGKKRMPAFKEKLGKLDPMELVKFIRSLAPKAPEGK